MTPISPRSPDRPPGSSDVRSAWLSVLLLPVAVVLSFLVGEGLIDALGYPVGGEEPPLWAVLVATVPALAMMWVPAAVSGWFATRAARAGDRRGWVPAIGLALVALFFLGLNVVAGLLS